MDRVANLLNDSNKTDYTYAVQIPYLNMAIEEYSDLMVESNSPLTNLVANQIIMPAGIGSIWPNELPIPGGIDPGWPRYPNDLIEIQEIGERVSAFPQKLPVVQSDAKYPFPKFPFPNPSGHYFDDTRPFKRLPRKEFRTILPIADSLLYWTWESGIIIFNPPGANQDMEVEIKYLQQGVPYVANENTVLYMIGARTYLAYKTAALCSFFIGENETRAQVLQSRADEAVERSISINNKGRQQIMTRHRPFRAAYKARGGF